MCLAELLNLPFHPRQKLLKLKISSDLLHLHKTSVMISFKTISVLLEHFVKDYSS